MLNKILIKIKKTMHKTITIIIQIYFNQMKKNNNQKKINNKMKNKIIYQLQMLINKIIKKNKNNKEIQELKVKIEENQK